MISTKAYVPRVKEWLKLHKLETDALYLVKENDIFKHTDFTQIYSDFGLTDVKKISEKFLFVSPMEVDLDGSSTLKEVLFPH